MLNSLKTKIRKIHNIAWFEVIEARLLAVFNGLDGFGQILFFWGLMCSLMIGLTLICIAFYQISYWALFAGVIMLNGYFYLGRIGKELLDKMSPYDG